MLGTGLYADLSSGDFERSQCVRRLCDMRLQEGFSNRCIISNWWQVWHRQKDNVGLSKHVKLDEIRSKLNIDEIII